MTWTFSEIWNRSLDQGREERKMLPRERLWASELGNSNIDLFLRLKGVAPSNPPNNRSKRKFEAGNIWEWILTFILKRAGILISKQDYVSYQYPGLLEVTGKLDVIAGGHPDYDKALREIEVMELPEIISRATKNLILDYQQKYPQGLNEIIVEIKSVGSYMFERLERTQQPMSHHRFQLFHYLKGKGMSEGRIMYICKDDCRLMEFPVYLNDKKMEDEYRSRIEEVTKVVKSGMEPLKEKEIVWQDYKFSQNWQVGYSNYLTKLYGYESQMKYEEKVKPVVARINRVINRLVKGEKVTDKNKIVIEEIKNLGFDIDRCIREASRFKDMPEEPEKEL